MYVTQRVENVVGALGLGNEFIRLRLPPTPVGEQSR